MLSGIIQSNSEVLDFGCGCGLSTLAMGKAFSDSKFYGYDIDQGSIDRAHENWLNMGSIENVKFECQDVSKLNLSEDVKYDVCTLFLTLCNMTHPTKTLKLAKRFIKENGSVLVLDSDVSPTFNPKATNEFSAVADSVLLHLPWSRPTDGELGEEVRVGTL